MSYKDEKYKVAIVGAREHNCSSCDDSAMVAETITEWEELTWEEIRLLQDGLCKINNSSLNYEVVYQPVKQNELVITSIAHGRKLAAETLKRQEERMKEEEAKKKEREDKKNKKNIAQRKAEFEKLKAEFEKEGK